jgi:hypothetical protein
LPVCRRLREADFKVKKLIKDGKDLKIIRTGGPKTKKCTAATIRRVAAKIERDLRKSIPKLAAEHKMAVNSMKRILNNDLGMVSRVVQEKPLLTIDTLKKTLQKSQEVTPETEEGRRRQSAYFFGQKLFVADALVNRRNSRYLTDLPVTVVGESVRISPFSKAPAKVMVLGIVASDGKKCPIIFVPDGEKVTADSYQALLRRHVIPWLSATYPEGNYVFQQDGSPAHTANSTQQFIESNMAANWSKTVWPPYSPNLNPLDYGIWGVMQIKVNATSHENKSALARTIWRADDPANLPRVQAAPGESRRR